MYRLNPKNLQAHLDIESDIQRIRNGTINFVLKINRGNLVDYVIYESLRDTEFTASLVDRKAGN